MQKARPPQNELLRTGFDPRYHLNSTPPHGARPRRVQTYPIAFTGEPVAAYLGNAPFSAPLSECIPRTVACRLAPPGGSLKAGPCRTCFRSLRLSKNTTCDPRCQGACENFPALSPGSLRALCRAAYKGAKPFAVAQSATESAPVPRRPAHTRPLPANRRAPALSHARDALKARNLFRIQTCDAPAWRGGRKRRAKRETPCRAMRISGPEAQNLFRIQARPAHTRPLPANRRAPALSHARDALKARNLFRIQTCDAPAWRGGRKRRAKRETPCRAMRISAAGRSGRGFKTTGPGRGVRPIPPPGRLFQRPSLRGGFARAAFSRAGSPRRCARTPAGEAASGAADARRRPGKAA